jgi:hypothetical protein
MKKPSTRLGSFIGAGDETQTRGLFLGKEALYQLSYTRTSEPTVGFRKQKVFCFLSPSGRFFLSVFQTAVRLLGLKNWLRETKCCWQFSLYQLTCPPCRKDRRGYTRMLLLCKNNFQVTIFNDGQLC